MPVLSVSGSLEPSVLMCTKLLYISLAGALKISFLNGGHDVFETSSLSLKDTLGLGMDQGFDNLILSIESEI